MRNLFNKFGACKSILKIILYLLGFILNILILFCQWLFFIGTIFLRIKKSFFIKNKSLETRNVSYLRICFLQFVHFHFSWFFTRKYFLLLFRRLRLKFPCFLEQSSKIIRKSFRTLFLSLLMSTGNICPKLSYFISSSIS